MYDVKTRENGFGVTQLYVTVVMWGCMGRTDKRQIGIRVNNLPVTTKYTIEEIRAKTGAQDIHIELMDERLWASINETLDSA